jgi:hypothetical protein
MNTEQFFLGDSETQIPSRWRQSFPAGRFVGLSDLQSLNLDGWDGLLWISCADAEWQTKLNEARLKIPSAKVVVLSDAPQEQQGCWLLTGGLADIHTHTPLLKFFERLRWLCSMEAYGLVRSYCNVWWVRPSVQSPSDFHNHDQCRHPTHGPVYQAARRKLHG